ncbi:MAG: hypothetical protein AAF989_03270, partial [Planctomycetota bacterium]
VNQRSVLVSDNERFRKIKFWQREHAFCKLSHTIIGESLMEAKFNATGLHHRSQRISPRIICVPDASLTCVLMFYRMRKQDNTCIVGKQLEQEPFVFKWNQIRERPLG